MTDIHSLAHRSYRIALSRSDRRPSTDHSLRGLRMSTQSSLLLLLCCGMAGCAEIETERPLRAGVTFDIHMVVDEPTETSKEAKDPITGDVLHLVTPPVITTADFSTGSVAEDENGNVSLQVQLTEVGGRKIANATAESGHRLAMVINGKVTSAPKVITQIGAKFQVAGEKNKADWEAILE